MALLHKNGALAFAPPLSHLRGVCQHSIANRSATRSRSTRRPTDPPVVLRCTTPLLTLAPARSPGCGPQPADEPVHPRHPAGVRRPARRHAEAGRRRAPRRRLPGGYCGVWGAPVDAVLFSPRLNCHCRAALGKSARTDAAAALAVRLRVPPVLRPGPGWRGRAGLPKRDRRSAVPSGVVLGAVRGVQQQPVRRSVLRCGQRRVLQHRPAQRLAGPAPGALV